MSAGRSPGRLCAIWVLYYMKVFNMIRLEIKIVLYFNLFNIYLQNHL